jgi:hypothetical protein
MTFSVFSEEQWQIIRSVRKTWPADIDWQKVREKLEQHGRDFWSRRTSRLQRPPGERKKLERWLKSVNRMREEMKEPTDDLDSPTKLLQKRIEERLIGYDFEQTFKGRADAHREGLYWCVMHVWTETLDGPLTFSRDQHDASDSPAPTGPLVKFLLAVLWPILGDESPGAHGIGDIIRKAQQARR